MLLADEFYLIAHADTTGQPRLHVKAAGYGLAAGLLAELCLMQRVTVDAARIRVLPPERAGASGPPQDLLQHTVLDHLTAESQLHPVRDWLAFLGRTAVEDVARRLTRSGVLDLVETRRPWGVTRKYVPASVNEAAWPMARVTARLTRRDAMDLTDQILAGLAFATGLTREMLWDDESGASRAHLGNVIAALPSSLRALVMETETAVSKVAATRT